MSGLIVSDSDLVASFLKGEESSFEELLSRYSAKVFSMASRLTRNQDDAEEVLQDVFVTVHRKLKGFEGKSSFSSWLYRIAVNTCLMKLRKRRQDRTVAIEDVVPDYCNSSLLRSNEQLDSDVISERQRLFGAIEAAIARLPEDYRPVFVLRDIDGLSSRQVGKMLKISIPAVKSRLHRSRIMMRRKLLPLYRELTETEHEIVDEVMEERTGTR